MIKYLVAASLSILLAGCAAPHNTHATAQEADRTYLKCVINYAKPLVSAPDSAIDIATVSANRCETERAAVRLAVQNENSSSYTGNAYARGYSDGLRRDVIAKVASMIMESRTK